MGAIARPTERFEDLPAGTYQVDEELPPDVGGTWTLEAVNCLPNAALLSTRRIARSESVTIEVPDAPGATCTFFNRFTPAGKIILRKTTLGGTASTRFQVRPETGDPRPERQQVAVTTEPGEPVLAEGQPLGQLPIGDYSIQETIGGPDRWEVARVTCDGAVVPSVAGRIVISLTDGDPVRDCTFVNRRLGDDPPPDPPPTPQPPPEPVPPPDEGDVAGETVASPVAELRVTKRVVPRRTRVGGLLRYVVTVVNRGPDPAEAVTIGERYPARAKRAVRLQASKGTCRNRPPRYCRFGTLAPGERVTVRAAIRPRRAGRARNAVAVNTATQQRTTRGKRASALAVVLPARPPRFTG